MNTRVRIEDPVTKEIRPPSVGEPFQRLDGKVCKVGKAGEVRLVHPQTPKRLSPSKERRKLRRAAELEEMRRPKHPVEAAMEQARQAQQDCFR